MLFDSHGHAWCQMQAKSTPFVTGLQNPLFADHTNWQLHHLTSVLLQLRGGGTCLQLHHQPGHLVMSFVYQGKVYVFNSMNSASLAKCVHDQLAHMVTTPLAPTMEVTLMRMHKQTRLECCLRACAAITQAAEGATPVEIAETVPVARPQMYAHMADSFAAGEIKPFPSKGRKAHKDGCVLATVVVKHHTLVTSEERSKRIGNHNTPTNHSNHHNLNTHYNPSNPKNSKPPNTR
jgi:hypothetical protein